MFSIKFLSPFRKRSILHSRRMNGVPCGVWFFQRLSGYLCPCLAAKRDFMYKTSVVLLTYLAYMSYHLSRKPISVVKAQLYRNCTGLTPPPGVDPVENPSWCSWEPFEDAELLGQLDSVYLFTYAAFMFLSGYVAERVNLRYFLSLGMLLSGIFCYMFGIARTYNIHWLWYFMFVQFASGIVQSSGWPGVVTVMSNWFGKSKRGLIFGLWNSHTSFGNILGALIAAEYVQSNWAYSFIMPGILIGFLGFVLFLFLVVSPGDVGCQHDQPDIPEEEPQRPVYRRLVSQVANGSHSDYSSETDDTEIIIGEQEVQRRASRGVTERTRLMPSSQDASQENAIGFFTALRLPGVLEYSFCLFFSKLVSYTFLYWLPFYVEASTSLNTKVSADLATLFDIGGIVGAIAAGVISDETGMSATTCMGMLALAAPMMLIYEQFSHYSLAMNMTLLVLVGTLVNGPYALITTAVSADLGTSVSSTGDGADSAKALATVTAIIDGTGSIGAAVGPLLASFVQGYGWRNVFIMLMVADLMAMVLLLRLFKGEMVSLWQRIRRRRGVYRRVDRLE